ncbi:hypothetical protein Q2T40_14300 [Winogradskyella maritima]|uniref:Uncharacterized protein n=1 Tax=Winogradskyella maritima TaxID=1517766 RepID=A0ABV8AGG5_9FLAO|nr:hypothetical protein [Winogradskyella maritima]
MKSFKLSKHKKKWIITILIIFSLTLTTVVFAILNPSIFYTHKTEFGQYIIYHSSELEPEFQSRLNKVDYYIKKSEYFNSNLKFKLCLNDGSFYPRLMEILRGPAFGWGFHNIATFRGDFNFTKNEINLRGYKWNLEQLMAHELTHCLQFLKLGLFNSNPLGDHAHWKWEGYAEYISRKNVNQKPLQYYIDKYNIANINNPTSWHIELDDNTIAPKSYYEYWLFVRYCLDIKVMSYDQLLELDISTINLKDEMLNWYKNNYN